MKCNNILEAVGHTPLVRLNRINQGLKPQIYVKAEFTNPGGSVKDRIGISMIDEAEKKGLLKPGGTIIEGTSRSEEHTSELQSLAYLVCRLLLEKKKKIRQ